VLLGFLGCCFSWDDVLESEWGLVHSLLIVKFNHLHCLSVLTLNTLQETHQNLQDRQCAYNVTPRGVRAATLLQWKSDKYYILSVFLALGIQQVMRMLHIVICGPSGYRVFSPLPHKQCDFGKEKLSSSLDR
jgi:hypothetical protein